MIYRDFLSLTNDEIEFIVKDIFPTTKFVRNIKKIDKIRCFACEIQIEEDIVDELTLSLPDWDDPGITTKDFTLTYEETLKWKQFLIAKGCDPLFNKNPYLQFDTDSFVEKLIGEIDKERNDYTKILCENTTISNNAKEHYACCLDCFTKIRLLVEELSKNK